MAYRPIPAGYRQSSPVDFNIDYFDFISGAGYKKLYLAGIKDSVGNKFILSTDAGLISDTTNYRISGNAQDTDFDITFNNPVTIANAEATISYTTTVDGADANSIVIAWTVYHVDGASAETSLGTVTDAGTTDGDPAHFDRRTVKVLLTKKRFKVGDKLRLNAITTANSGNARYHIDPAGTKTFTAQSGGTITSSASINMPFKIDL